MKKIIMRRPVIASDLTNEIHPLLQRIYSGRGIQSVQELEKGLEKLEPFQLLTNIHSAVACLVNALQEKQHIMIVGDFDADGATSTALAVDCLRKMGAARVSYLVPNRFQFGYGLTPEIVDVAEKSSPNLIVTVDNGISSLEGVIRANDYGIKVIITDHHLPPSLLPPAEAIVNPNLLNDLFPSKNLAGVGVIFYVMLALRAKLRELSWFEKQSIPEPNLAEFLDLVALGTIADVVPLDKNNRILVHQGLARIKAGKVRPGIRMLLQVAKKSIAKISASDLGFAIAPRLNAAGRLEDMSLGIECLLATKEADAIAMATNLDSLNIERQQIEEGMREQALNILKQLQLQQNLPVGVCLYDPSWHQGISGILASRVKDLLHRPVFVFAPHNDNELKGSGRSIAGLHLKDLLERIATENDGLIKKFGGHAMAAGVSINTEDFPRFAELFSQTVENLLAPEDLQGIIHSDGQLCPTTLNLETALLLQNGGPWGQGFPEPIFDGEFRIVNHRLLKEKHVKFLLSSVDTDFMVDAIAFNLPETKRQFKEDGILHVAYRLDVNEFRGNQTVQLLIDYFDVLDNRS